MILHLGVIDVPYVQAPSKRQRKRTGGTVTTGDVAGFLENRYNVMQIFFIENEAKIAGYLEESVRGTLENLLLGAPATNDPFGAATSEIDDRFKQFISQGEIEKLGIAGVPTQAALDRRAGKKRSTRFKKKRPGTGVSFVDSGLYISSFRSWID